MTYYYVASIIIMTFFLDSFTFLNSGPSARGCGVMVFRTGNLFRPFRFSFLVPFRRMLNKLALIPTFKGLWLF